jgi:DNA-binding LacI/PurR family transcriptional regulator
VASDIIALGLLVAAKSLAVRVPDDLSVVGYDDIPVARYLTPSLTTVRAPLAETARAAVNLIVERIGDPGRPAKTITIPVSLMVRESAATPTPLPA